MRRLFYVSGEFGVVKCDASKSQSLSSEPLVLSCFPSDETRGGGCLLWGTLFYRNDVKRPPCFGPIVLCSVSIVLSGPESKTHAAKQGAWYTYMRQLDARAVQ
jgi:hypothetical protein